MALKFNYTPKSKTPKGSAPRPVRMITKDHDAYKIYLRAKELQDEDTGENKHNVDHKYVDQAIQEFNNKSKEVNQ